MRAAIPAIVLAAALGFVGLTAACSTNFDFRAFYCAGTALRMHANPYHTEPLHTCERTRTDRTFAAFARTTALPAPQPGYDIAAFSVLAALPFAIASKIWTAILLACALSAIVLVHRISRTPVTTVVAAFWLSLCITSIFLGELIPVCICAIAAAASFAQRERWTLAGVAAAATLVEPHIGIPICVSVALWAPRARTALGLSTLGLGMISLAAVGISANAEYLWAVLPAHALSEIGSDAQLSLTAVLHALGAPDAAALRAGTLSYVLIGIASAFGAKPMAKKFGDSAFVVAVPAAFAVLGGVFMHVTDLAAAVPLVFLLLSHSSAVRAVSTQALVLIAIPWWLLATPMLLGRTGFSLAAITVTYLIWNYDRRSAPFAFAAGLAVFFGASELVHWYAAASSAIVPVHGAGVRISSAYPEASWGWFNARLASTGVAASWLLRIPSWLGLLLLAYACLKCTRTRSAEHNAGLPCASLAGAAAQ